MPDLTTTRPVRGPRAIYEFRSSLLLLPYLTGAFILLGIPLLLSIALSFTFFDGLSSPIWAGLANFRDLYWEPLFRVALVNSLTFVFLAVPLRILAALGLALLLSRPRRGSGLFRAAVYLPTVVPEIAYALLWLWLLNPLYGPLNQILRWAGLPAPAWLVNSETALPALVMMSIFTIGEGFVLLLAALRAIPPEIFDAAWTDGSGRIATFTHITLPLIKPWLVLLIFRDVILTLQTTFTPAYIMTGGGPYYSTLFLPLLAYEEAFDRLRFGTGSAIMLVMFLLTLGLVMLLYGIIQDWGYEE